MVKLENVKSHVSGKSVHYAHWSSIINSASQNHIWYIVEECVEKLVLNRKTMVEYIYEKEFT